MINKKVLEDLLDKAYWKGKAGESIAVYKKWKDTAIKANDKKFRRVIV